MAEQAKPYEILREGNEEVMKIDANSWPYAPSIEDNANVMVSTIEKLLESPNVARVMFNQKRNYSYDSDQTQGLLEIAMIYQHLLKQKRIVSMESLGFNDNEMKFFSEKLGTMQYVVMNLLRSDPIGAYVEVKRLIREEAIKYNSDHSDVREKYINNLKYIYNLLESTRIISFVKDRLEGYEIGDRSFYREIFKPTITPDFMYTRVMAMQPMNGEQIDAYSVGRSEITVFNTPNDIKKLYHIIPPEFKLTEDKYELLDLARNILAEHKPKEEEFLEPEKMRTTFYNIGKDLIEELAEHKKIPLEYSEIQELAEILVRYTVGFGLIEVLLQDDKIQDITINGPIGETRIFIVHQEHDECVTNIIPSRDDGLSWASKFRLLSGRPLDEANPVLDTELTIPGARARVAIMSRPLSPNGLAFALRRHRDKPWTLPLFMQKGMISAMGAGLISFLIDGSRTLLFAGTRSSGKTSLLGSSLVEIMRNHRIITVEDSVTGDSEILVKKSNKIFRTTMGELVDSAINEYGSWYTLSDHEILGNYESIEVLALGKDNKIVWQKPSKLIRHKVKKKIYEIKTRTGKTVKVTEDHSLFGIGDDGKLKEIKPTAMSVGSYLATIRNIPFNTKETLSLNVLDYINLIKGGYLLGTPVKSFVEENYELIRTIAKQRNITRATFAKWKRTGLLPIDILKESNLPLTKLKSPETLFKIGINGKALSTEISFDRNLLTLAGCWLADGCYDKNSVIISSFEEESNEITRRFASNYGLSTNLHSDGGSLMINSQALKFVFNEILGLKGNAYTKRIPSWVFSLSKQQIAYVLKGLFSGDGCVTDREISISLASLELLKDIQTLLLGYNILLRISNKKPDATYGAGISATSSVKKFAEEIGLIQSYKNKKLTKLSSRVSTHDSTDVIPLPIDTKRRLLSFEPNRFNSNDYITRGNSIGRTKLATVLLTANQKNEFLCNLTSLATADICWDQVKEIKELCHNELYVYDLSVPECENFVCGNILVHNTMELPVESMRKLGYNIQPMKVRAALTTGGGEITADEGVRTSLRMGDSCLIVGEIRSVEAKALYEAMRIGALANVVAGTIHGADPYGVYDRVVNDLGVPKTSFKATDIIIVSNPVKTADGLHSKRRVMQIAEVRKHWETDPLKEKGFMDLMTYNTKTDMLEPTQDLINGDSEVLKSIAGNVPEWAGNWDAVWENIMLRAKIKETLVNYSIKANNLEILEAPFVVLSNDTFHKISDIVKTETGNIDAKEVYREWHNWLKRQVKQLSLR